MALKDEQALSPDSRLVTEVFTRFTDPERSDDMFVPYDFGHTDATEAVTYYPFSLNSDLCFLRDDHLLIGIQIRKRGHYTHGELERALEGVLLQHQDVIREIVSEYKRFLVTDGARFVQEPFVCEVFTAGGQVQSLRVEVILNDEHRDGADVKEIHLCRREAFDRRSLRTKISNLMHSGD